MNVNGFSWALFIGMVPRYKVSLNNWTLWFFFSSFPCTFSVGHLEGKVRGIPEVIAYYLLFTFIYFSCH